MEALSQKMREEQAQYQDLAEAQDKAVASVYRQIDSVKQASAGLQELQRISADPTGQKQWRDWSAGLSGADF